MNWVAMLSICFGAVVLMNAVTATAQIRYRQNNKWETTELSGLFGEPDCSSSPLRGKVVKREFAEDALTVKAFVVEIPNGTREFVNVELPENLDRATQSIVLDGLQRLLREGRDVNGVVEICGGSGRFLFLGEIH